jgi:CubicO group peptidase (beta-lactamase class C family)
MRNVLIKILTYLFLLGAFACQSQNGSLPSAKPESVGMSSARLKVLDQIIQEAIDRKDFPGADILVARKGKIVWRKVFGHCQWIPEYRPMERSMVFDMASLTKPVATATSIMILAENGNLSLWDKVVDYVPEFIPFVDEDGETGEDARIWHLLTHTAGLPDYIWELEVLEEFGNPISLESLVNFIARLEKLYPPGEDFFYSCLDFIILSLIVKQVSGKTLAEFAHQNIFSRLNMQHTFYTPPEEFHPRCIPTEVIDGVPLIGVVHDPLARLLGGVSGNAGLFSTADDLAVFAQMMLNHGEFKGARILSPLAVERMSEIYRMVDFAGRGLGWDLDSSYSSNQGNLFGPRTFGHTGYTGTSLIIDPETETFVIFLTNRVHPYDEGKILSLRSCVANVVAGSILKK